MPACAAIMISTIAFSPPASAPFMSPLSSEAKGSLSCHSGMLRRQRLHAVEREGSWKYIGCSAQSVPSLSKMAMRSAGGTKSGEPSLSLVSTKATMAFFGAPSFHDGSGSDWACACVKASAKSAAHQVRLLCTSWEFLVIHDCHVHRRRHGDGRSL